MLHNYKSYTKILESNAREKNIEKVKNKIKKFANIPSIYNWAIDKCISDKSTEGIQYAVWIANYLKDVVVREFTTKNITKQEILNYIAKGIGSDEKIDNLVGDFNVYVEEYIENINDSVNYVLDWLKNPLREEKVNLSELSFDAAYKKSEEWHNSLKATGKITDESGKVIIEFDDGYYWIDLQTTYSKAEADAMGHCGNTNDGDTLLSLRDANKSPHVTVAYDSKDGAIYQMKGRNNKKPIAKYYPYIYRLLVDPEIKPKYFAYEYLKEEDFNMSDFDKETFQKVFKYNPNIVYDSIEFDYKMVNGLINKNLLNKDDVKDIMLNAKEVSDNVFLSIVSDNDSDMFSNEELKQMYINSEIKLSKYGELPKIMLYNKNIIDKEEFANFFNELSVVNDKLYIEGTEEDLYPFMSDGVKLILFDEDPFGNWDFSHYKMERAEQVWDDISKEVKEKIIEKMIGEEISYNYYRDDEERYFDDVEITEEMIKCEEKDYYLYYNNQKYQIDLILDENEDDSLSDLYDSLSDALKDAQRYADQSEYYKKSKKALEGVLGEYTIESRTITNYDIFKKKYYDVFIFELSNFIDLDVLEDKLREDYTYGDVDYEKESYGSFWQLAREFFSDDIADFDDRYGLYGDIESSTLNECVIDRLSDL